MSSEFDRLNASFAIGNIARIVAGEGGLAKIQISSRAASGEIYLHGAQVTAWRPVGGDDVLFLSRESRWEDGRAIRGGIPVCFPWFRAKADNPQAPPHGFARTRSWRLEAVKKREDDVVVTMATASDEASRRWWPHDVRLVLHIEMGAQLRLALTATNTGANSLQFEEALHTYYRVGDVAEVRIAGLDGVAFLDNVDSNRKKMQQGDIAIIGPTDNAYINTQGTLILTDPVLGRCIRIEKLNSSTTVVWNLWETGAKTLADLGDDEWRQMACVEASNILSSAVTLAPGEEHTMETTITVTGGRSSSAR
jgi:glucose-6-phosphate 1-epimerase